MPAACWANRSRSHSSPAVAHASGRRCTSPCPRAMSKSKSPHRFSTIPPERGSMSEMAPRLAPPVQATEWLKALPPTTRWVLHGDARARALAAPVFGVAFAETACRATVVGERATLWLGPGEYLLLDASPDVGTAP